MFEFCCWEMLSTAGLVSTGFFFDSSSAESSLSKDMTFTRRGGGGAGRDSGCGGCAAAFAGTEVGLVKSWTGDMIEEILVFSLTADLFFCEDSGASYS